MADIFISYAHADGARIQHLARALETAGFSLWWDPHLEGGVRFSAELDNELNAAKAIVVCWSKASVNSMWVADEATVGRDKGNLVPISLDGTPPPLGFRQVQTIGFENWADEPNAPEVEALARAIAKVMAAPSSTARAPTRKKFFGWRRHQSHTRPVMKGP